MFAPPEIKSTPWLIALPPADEPMSPLADGITDDTAFETVEPIADPTPDQVGVPLIGRPPESLLMRELFAVFASACDTNGWIKSHCHSICACLLGLSAGVMSRKFKRMQFV